MGGRIARGAGLFGAVALVAALGGCGGSGRDPSVVDNTFSAVDPLLAAQVDVILRAAANSVDESLVSSTDPNEPSRMTIAIVDRLGNILRLYSRGVSARTGIGADLSIDDLPNDSERVPINFALALARAAAFLSHSQAPLTSRTGEFLNAFHFPPNFLEQFDIDPPEVFPNLTIPRRIVNGVSNTPQADLFQITYSNRGTFIAAPATDPGQSQTNPPTVFVTGKGIPQLTNPDGSVPSPGLGGLPGGVPLYITSTQAVDGDEDDDGNAENAGGQFNVARRLVGAIACYVSDANGIDSPVPAVAEEAALTGALAVNPLATTPGDNFFFPGVPREGKVFLGSVLLPALNPAPPPGMVADSGSFTPADQVLPTGQTSFAVDGTPDPEGYYIGPQSSAAAGGLTASEVDTIIRACDQAAKETHAAIRFPSEVQCRMWISVCDADGVLLGVFRQQDATIFSYEISLTKSRNAAYFSNPNSRNGPDAGPLAGRHPLTGFRFNAGQTIQPDGTIAAGSGSIVDIFPQNVLESTGVAVTARTLGYLGVPFFPPTIDGSGVSGPLNFLVQKTENPASFQLQAFQLPGGTPPPQPQTQSGIIFFPGSAPLYRNGVLVGGLGVSGDGVVQDDFVTAQGILKAEAGFQDSNGQMIAPIGFDLEPPPDIRCDHFTFEGTGIPYMKFPQFPNG
jgi:uncharacterized protein GlcG (DUF336 family)